MGERHGGYYRWRRPHFKWRALYLPEAVDLSSSKRPGSQPSWSLKVVGRVYSRIHATPGALLMTSRGLPSGARTVCVSTDLASRGPRSLTRRRSNPTSFTAAGGP